MHSTGSCGSPRIGRFAEVIANAAGPSPVLVYTIIGVMLSFVMRAMGELLQQFGAGARAAGVGVAVVPRAGCGVEVRQGADRARRGRATRRELGM